MEQVLGPGQATRNFGWDELRCKGCPGTCGHSRDGRSLVNVAPGALAKLQAMRDLIGAPIIVTSASRCPLHNARVGGAPLSQHRATQVQPSTAFDLVIRGAATRRMLIDAAIEVGFGGIGQNYRSFVHVDDRGHRARW